MIRVNLLKPRRGHRRDPQSVWLTPGRSAFISGREVLIAVTLLLIAAAMLHLNYGLADLEQAGAAENLASTVSAGADGSYRQSDGQSAAAGSVDGNEAGAGEESPFTVAPNEASSDLVAAPTPEQKALAKDPRRCRCVAPSKVATIRGLAFPSARSSQVTRHADHRTRGLSQAHARHRRAVHLRDVSPRRPGPSRRRPARCMDYVARRSAPPRDLPPSCSSHPSRAVQGRSSYRAPGIGRGGVSEAADFSTFERPRYPGFQHSPIDKSSTR